MNGNFQSQKDMFMSSSQNQMRDHYDYFDASLDAGNEQRNTSPPRNGLRRPPPTLQTHHGSPTMPTVGVTSPVDSNIPTQGDATSPIQSPKEEDYEQHHYQHSHNQNYNIGIQAPNQGQHFQQNRNRTTENETEIFSFRREGQQNNQDHGRDQEHGNHFPGSHRDELSPLSEREYYDKTRMWFVKLKKFYVFFALNAACLGLIIFNLLVAYSTENINFALIQEIDQQFQEKVVLDIDLAARNLNCNAPYVESKMGYWPGYKKICQCSTQTYLGECQGTDLLAGCKSFDGFNAVNVSNWNEKKICLRKSEKSILEYYESSDFIESYNGNFLCPNGMKKCIVSSNKNFICVGRFEFCPVTLVEMTSDANSAENKYKAQLKFSDEKTLIYDNTGAVATTFTDIIVDHQNCDKSTRTVRAQIDTKYCQNVVNKTLLDTTPEISLVEDNDNKNIYGPIQDNNITMGLYALKMNYMDMCPFNNTFNPVVLNSQLTNWQGVKTLLFVNPFFLSTLLVVNLLRVYMVKYINKNSAEGPSSKRKKEVYHIFGRSFTGSSVIVITEVATILYYIFWGYLLLNPDRLIAEKWLEMSCIPESIKAEIQYMIRQFSRIETFNMVTIGPMILGCITEALFSQYKLITAPYHQLRRDPF